MDTALIIILSIFALILLVQFWGMRKAKSIIGQPAPDTSTVDHGLQSECKVLFFHAPGCRPCKAMLPMIERLQQDYRNLFSVDITEHLLLARQFRLAGTPSIFVIREGKITDVKLGSASENWLIEQLD